MKRIYLIISLCLLLTVSAAAQRRGKRRTAAKAAAVTQQEMQRIYETVKTPYKYGMVVAPADNGHKIDCPTVFRKDGKWAMTYVCYNGKGGTDGRG